MLFRTVYGPELGAIYSYCEQKIGESSPATREEIRGLFLVEGESISSQSIDDAITFLISANLVDVQDSSLIPLQIDTRPFPLKLLAACRAIEVNKDASDINSLFSGLISELFIQPDHIFIADVHTAVNNLEVVSELGGISKEKVQTWKRVMEFLGVGYRAFGGFICAYSPSLVKSVISLWDKEQGTLQEFFEFHFNSYLPFQNREGLLAQSVATSLQFVAKQGEISLYPLQDSPSKAYIGNLRGLKRSRARVT
jgi:hypothetical protein